MISTTAPSEISPSRKLLASKSYSLLRSIVLLLALAPLSLMAQHEEHAEEAHKENKWRVAIAMINSHVPAIDDPKSRAIIPTWGVDLEYRLTPKVILGLLVDVELMRYRVTHGDFTELEREYPVTVGFAAFYEFTHNLSLGTAFAREFEPHESFNMVSFIGAYTFHLPNDFDIAPGLTYNTRINAFDTFSFNLAIGKSF